MESGTQVIEASILAVIFRNISFLVVDKPKLTFLQFVRKVSNFLKVEVDDSMRSPPAVVAFENCPKMSVSGDCGIFVIEYMQSILRVCVMSNFVHGHD
jgi:hypothetical protein